MDLCQAWRRPAFRVESPFPPLGRVPPPSGETDRPRGLRNTALAHPRLREPADRLLRTPGEMRPPGGAASSVAVSLPRKRVVDGQNLSVVAGSRQRFHQAADVPGVP